MRVKFRRGTARLLTFIEFDSISFLLSQLPKSVNTFCDLLMHVF